MVNAGFWLEAEAAPLGTVVALFDSWAGSTLPSPCAALGFVDSFACNGDKGIGEADFLLWESP